MKIWIQAGVLAACLQVSGAFAQDCGRCAGFGQKTTLDPLRLQTREDIQKRDANLGPVFKLYSTATTARAVEALESAYGLNAYYDIVIENGDYGRKPALSNKAAIMAAIVPYFMVDQHQDNQYYSMRPTAFDRLDHSLMSGFQEVQTNSGPAALASVKNGKPYEATYSNSLLVAAVKDSSWIDLFSMGQKYDHKSLYTNDQRPLFETPVIANLAKALQESQIKSLDATIVFLAKPLASGDAYQAVYPDFTPLAPIPQPILYISSNASAEDLGEMIEREAPRVFEYNVLFTRELLPQVSDLARVLAKYPRLEEKMNALNNEIKRHNQYEILKEAFLDFAFTSSVVTGSIAVGVATQSPLAAWIVEIAGFTGGVRDR